MLSFITNHFLIYLNTNAVGILMVLANLVSWHILLTLKRPPFLQVTLTPIFIVILFRYLVRCDVTQGKTFRLNMQYRQLFIEISMITDTLSFDSFLPLFFILVYSIQLLIQRMYWLDILFVRFRKHFIISFRIHLDLYLYRVL